MKNEIVKNTNKNVATSVSRAYFTFANAVRFSSYCVYYYCNEVAYRKGR